MNGHDLKKALMRRHEFARHLHPAADAAAALEAICVWMGWEAASLQREARKRGAAAGVGPEQAYQEYFRHPLRERLNDAKWEFVRQHPHDPAAQEIIALARAWQARIDRRATDDDRVVEFPTDEEAYGEPERHMETLG